MLKRFFYTKKLLSNKLTVFLIPINYIKTFYTYLYIKVGSFYETENNQGISHLLEHLIHEGTAKFPSHQLLAEAIEAEGMYENALTSFNITVYWFGSHHQKAKKAIEFLYETVIHSLLPEESLDRTKKVIFNEINQFWLDPINQFNEEMFAKRTIKRTCYQNLAFGELETVKNIKYEEIIRWKNYYYQPANMILILIGNFHNDKILNEIKKTFGKLKNKEKIKKFKPPKVYYSNFLIHYKKNNSSQIYFYLSLPAFGYKEKPLKKTLGLFLLLYLLTESRTSRLYKALRQERSLVYSIRSSCLSYPTMGSLIIRGSCAKENLILTINLIKKEFEKIVNNGFTNKEIKKAKNLYNRDMITFNFETPQQIHRWIINEFLYYRKILLPEDYVKIIMSLTRKEIHILAKTIMSFDKLNLGFFGDLSENEIDQVKKVFDSH